MSQATGVINVDWFDIFVRLWRNLFQKGLIRRIGLHSTPPIYVPRDFVKCCLDFCRPHSRARSTNICSVTHPPSQPADRPTPLKVSNVCTGTRNAALAVFCLETLGAAATAATALLDIREIFMKTVCQGGVGAATASPRRASLDVACCDESAQITMRELKRRKTHGRSPGRTAAEFQHRPHRSAGTLAGLKAATRHWSGVRLIHGSRFISRQITPAWLRKRQGGNLIPSVCLPA